MLQEILAYVALAIALIYLVKKFFLKSKKSKKGCGGNDCGC